MTADEAIAALDLPASARVERRVPKTLLLEHGASTAADRRLISQGIDQIQWVAALKPTTIGVAAHRDDAREYVEVAVLRLALRAGAKTGRLVELLQRAIPYPLLAIVELADRLLLSVAHKRWSQVETGKAVLDGEPITVEAPNGKDRLNSAFASALSLARQPKASLLALYQGWLDTLLALEAARISGRLVLLPTEEARRARAEALREVARLDTEIARLRASAERERQLPRQVALNLELKRAAADRAAALAKL